MRNAFRIFRRDMKRLLRNPAAILVLIGVSILPSLYAWFNIAANIDPYANTSGIKVAVANLDTDATHDDLTINAETLDGRINELEEEHGGDEGFFAELDKVNKANVQARLKEIKGDAESAEERTVLESYLDLLVRQTEGKRQVKEAELALDSLALARYKSLTMEEIKTLVVEDKWLAALEQAVEAEVEKTNQRLTQRIKVLAERYETTLPELSASVEELERKVAAHLAKMGFAL